MKEEISGNVVEVRRKSDRVMTCANIRKRSDANNVHIGLKAKDQTRRKFVFMMKRQESGTW